MGGISVSISSHDSAEAFPFCRGKFIMPGQLPRQYPGYSCRGICRGRNSQPAHIYLWRGISVSISSHDSAEAFPFCRGKFIMPGQLPRQYPGQNFRGICRGRNSQPAHIHSCQYSLAIAPAKVTLPRQLHCDYYRLLCRGSINGHDDVTSNNC